MHNISSEKDENDRSQTIQCIQNKYGLARERERMCVGVWTLNRRKRKQCHRCVRVWVLNRKIVPNSKANRCLHIVLNRPIQNPTVYLEYSMPFIAHTFFVLFCFSLFSSLIHFIAISSRFLSINIYAYASSMESKTKLHSPPPFPHPIYSKSLIRLLSRFVFIHCIVHLV